MSNSEPSTIVPQGIPCMRGIIHVSIRMEKTVRSRFAAIHLPRSRMSSRTGLASPVEKSGGARSLALTLLRLNSLLTGKNTGNLRNFAFQNTGFSL